LNNYILIPAGTVIQSAATSVPGGWLACDGSLLNKYGIYAALFAAIGNTYGGLITDNSFNLPDLRGRTAIGSGTGAGLSARTLGQYNGEETHVLTTAEMPSHSHTSNATGGIGNYGLVYTSGHNTMNASVNDGNEIDLYQPAGSLTINTSGSGNAHNNMQPFLVLQFLIKY
jgi:microcystin-dependent protein